MAGNIKTCDVTAQISIVEDPDTEYVYLVAEDRNTSASTLRIRNEKLKEFLERYAGLILDVTKSDTYMSRDHEDVVN